MSPPVQPLETSTLKPAGKTPEWTVVVVTLLMAALAVTLVLPQFSESKDANPMGTLKDLADRRLPQLLQTTDPIQREGTGLAVYGRQLDRALPKDTRVFFSGMIGKENGSRGGYYYFLRNYLFPRHVEISVDGKATYHEGWFEGVDATSPTELQTNGFDLLLLMPPNQNDIKIIPLTQKGVPKQ